MHTTRQAVHLVAKSPEGMYHLGVAIELDERRVEVEVKLMVSVSVLFRCGLFLLSDNAFKMSRLSRRKSSRQCDDNVGFYHQTKLIEFDDFPGGHLRQANPAVWGH